MASVLTLIRAFVGYFFRSLLQATMADLLDALSRASVILASFEWVNEEEVRL